MAVGQKEGRDGAPTPGVTNGAEQRILVTGGAGFVGSHLCEKLIREGHKVFCLDNFTTGRLGNLDHLKGDKRLEVIRHDVTMPFVADVTEIYNLASPASPPHYQADPIRTMKTNVLGALHTLELAKLRGAKVFQASTSEVYGDPTVHPQPETYRGSVTPIGPRSCYDEGKRAAETLFFDYHRQHGVQIKVCRVFNTYGPRMQPDDGRVVSNFILQALESKEITIYGDGAQTRSFCYIDDLIDGALRLMRSPAHVTGPINLGNPSELTIAELADLIVELTGSRSRIVRRPLPTDDPRQRRPDIEKARAVLDWRPTVDLKEGLARTIAYFDQLLRDGALWVDRSAA